VKLFVKKGYIHLPTPAVMGILNITPDSFSDGGRYLSIDKAMARVAEMVGEGAHIIDVGGESTRPGAKRVGADEEIDRVLPVIESIKTEFDVLVSVDTYKDRVARAAVTEAGADIINDISALRFSEGMAATVAECGVPVILMHILGTPEDMQTDPFYVDVIADLKSYFAERLDHALSMGVRKESIILDPGIGFGKRHRDNIDIIKNLRIFTEFDCPILVGASRKSFLGRITGESVPDRRGAETLAANLVCLLNGASILRVHEVRSAVSSIKVWDALREFDDADRGSK
jgi:dihydropteroate synthase